MSHLIKGALLLLLFFSQKAIAQNYYNSPYTRYNIGDLVNSGFAHNRSMGGSSVALRPHNQINYLNPASYTSQDTNSFLFQFGFTARSATIITSEDSDQSANMNIEYIAIGLPITNWMSFSAGVVPYSRIQYAFTEQYIDPSIGESTTFDYSGFGGFNEFYLGAAADIKELVSIGININYLFGSLDRTQTSYLTDLQQYSAKIEHKENLIASDFYTKIGVQYYPTIQEKHKLVIGAAIDTKTNINVKLKGSTMRYNTAYNHAPYQDSLIFNVNTLDPLISPNKYAFGISYNYDDIITVTGEYIIQDWTGTKIVTSNFKTGTYESCRIGAEYTPVPLKKRTREKYFKRIHYRVGGYYTKTYLYHNDNNISDYGITAGIGLPWKNARKVFTSTTFNIGYQYGVRGTIDNGLIKEQYHFVTFGLTLHDFWFLKAKYD